MYIFLELINLKINCVLLNTIPFQKFIVALPSQQMDNKEVVRGSIFCDVKFLEVKFVCIHICKVRLIK